MAIKKHRLANRVIGVSRDWYKCKREAVKRKAIDEASIDPEIEVDEGANLFILSMPILTNLRWIKQVGPHLKPGAVVMDVGSTKEDVQNLAREYFSPGQFIGCHPMAGSEKKGIEHARADLFKGSVCFMTAANRKIEELWKRIGAHPIRLSAEEHDEWVARVSHIPHILAFALLRIMAKAPKQAFLSSIGYLNPSFKESARLSKSDPQIWADILWSNRRRILRALSEFSGQVGDLRKILRSKSSEDTYQRLLRYISSANTNARRLLPDEKKD